MPRTKEQQEAYNIERREIRRLKKEQKAERLARKRERDKVRQAHQSHSDGWVPRAAGVLRAVGVPQANMLSHGTGSNRPLEYFITVYYSWSDR